MRGSWLFTPCVLGLLAACASTGAPPSSTADSPARDDLEPVGTSEALATPRLVAPAARQRRSEGTQDSPMVIESLSGEASEPNTDSNQAADTSDSDAVQSVPAEPSNKETPEPPPAPPGELNLPNPRPLTPTTLGTLADASLVEISGLAVSLAEDRLLWGINDSGQAAQLYAIDLAADSRGTWQVDARNRDWEDLDSGYLDGSPTLVIADTGDNRQRRDESRLWLVTEPDVGAGPSSTPLQAQRLRFRFDDGPRNVESVAIADDALWLISKEAIKDDGRAPSRLYRLDLMRALSTPLEIAVAEFRTTLQVPRRNLAARLAAVVAGVDLDQATALDIDESRGVAWLLTYQHVKRFDRRGTESWSDTLARAPDARYSHGLRQAEALAVTQAGLVAYTSEGIYSPLLALPANWR